MHVDDLVEAIYQRSMSLTELRLALGVTDAQLSEAIWVLSFPGDRRVRWAAKDRSDSGLGQPDIYTS